MTSGTTDDTIQVAVLDSVLYGAGVALNYLDLRGQTMMDKIGQGILEYCFKTGHVEKTSDFNELANRVCNFFSENGYIGGFKFGQEGQLMTVTFNDWRYLGLMRKLRNEENYLLACPLCIAADSAFRATGGYPQTVYEELTPDGAFLRKFKIIPATLDSAPEALIPPNRGDLSAVRYDGTLRVGLPVFEAVEYGLAQGFDFLGAQAQLLLDNVGRSILNFIQGEGQLTLTGNHIEDLDEISSFFKLRGLADEMRVSFSPTEARVLFCNYRYEPVLRMLLDEGHRLVSCPFTTAARTVLRNSGWAVGQMQWTLSGDKDCTLVMPLLKVADQEFDEQEIGAIMDKL
jgi:hypothetical protein